MKAIVLGSTGYTGMMLLRILAEHPDIEAIIPVSHSSAGKPVRELDPGLGPRVERLLAGTGGRLAAIADIDPGSADVVFSALPHGAAAAIIGPLAGRVPVIDLSADFRITDAARYRTIYGAEHPHPELLSRAVYGLSEWRRAEIATADIIACPGCYPTATLLPLLPFADIVRSPAVVNALSGISGAGRKEEKNLLFNERSENMNAYNPGRSHRHVPEIEQALAAAGTGRQDGGLTILFTPHLVPVKQGMITTIVAELTEPLSQEEAERRLASAYEGSPFVGISPRGIPQSRDVRNSNRCDLGVRVHGSHLQLFSAQDNLYKGASGQAVQNMNIRLRLPEDAGLRGHGEF